MILSCNVVGLAQKWHCYQEHCCSVILVYCFQKQMFTYTFIGSIVFFIRLLKVNMFSLKLINRDRVLSQIFCSWTFYHPKLVKIYTESTTTFSTHGIQMRALNETQEGIFICWNQYLSLGRKKNFSIKTWGANVSILRRMPSFSEYQKLLIRTKKSDTFFSFI